MKRFLKSLFAGLKTSSPRTERRTNLRLETLEDRFALSTAAAPLVAVPSAPATRAIIIDGSRVAERTIIVVGSKGAENGIIAITNPGTVRGFNPQPEPPGFGFLATSSMGRLAT